MQSRQLYPSVLEIVGFTPAKNTANAIQALQLKGRAWSPQKLITWIIQPISFKSDATVLKNHLRPRRELKIYDSSGQTIL